MRRIHNLPRVTCVVLLAAVLGLFQAASPALAQGDAPDMPSGPLTRIAFGSCAKHWQPQPIWEAVLETHPDLWLFLGDAIYADTDGVTAWEVTEKQLQGEWNRFADKSEFQDFRSRVPMMGTWDNHDYGAHDGGAEFAGKEFSKRIFLDFFGEPKDSVRRRTPGIYDAKIIGPDGKRLQIILLDTRTFRGSFKLDERSKDERARIGKVGKYVPNVDPNATVLGKKQWAWLAKQLKQPAEIRLICSSTQIIPDEKGMDEWGNFPRDRQRLLDLAEDAGNVILLSGNVHFAEISHLEDGSLVEFTSSGMTHVNETYANATNSYRLAGPYVDVHFGLVEIDWEPTSTVTLKAIGLDGTVAFEHKITLQD